MPQYPPLPTSGDIRASQINTELAKGSTVATLSMNDANERGLAGKPVPGSTISFSDWYGKLYAFPGKRDLSFSMGTGFDFLVRTISLQTDGKFIVGGNFSLYNGTNRNRIARLHSNGLLDTTFNIGTGTNNLGFVITTSIQSDGRVIIGGFFTSYSGTTRNRIARLHANGVLDTGFNVGAGASWNVLTTPIQSDGKVIIGGEFTSYSGTTRNRIARLHTNGVLDTSFNVGAGANWSVQTTSIQPADGRVIIGGAFTSYSGTTRNRIARLHSNGVLDTSFNVGAGTNSNVFTTAIQSDGRVIIGGFFTSYSGTTINRIARLHSNGVLDTGFNVGAGTNSSVFTTAIQSDGRVIIGGAFTRCSGVTRNRIARLHSNGGLDTDFSISSGANDTVTEAIIQPNGRVVIGGNFTFYAIGNRPRIVRVFDKFEFL